MTIKYALIRSEIVRSFWHSLSSSPRLRTVVCLYAAGVGALRLALDGVLSGSITPRDVMIAIAWAVGAFAFMPLWLFIRGKTAERTLTISAQGIFTEIGSLKGQFAWRTVSEVTPMRYGVLIARVGGNAFFIPSRAFVATADRTEFLTQISLWRNHKQ
jgi:hypothetical protein